jgi:hypothetical protein
MASMVARPASRLLSAFLNRSPGHQEPGGELIGLHFIGVGRRESGLGNMKAVLGQHVIDMAFKKIVGEFVGNAEALEAVVINMGRIKNAERVAVRVWYRRVY